MYGFYPKNYKCEKVSELCEGHNVQTGECFGCKFGLRFDVGKCFDDNCQEAIDGKCVSCIPNFKKDDNGVCKYSDPYCIESYNSRCEACMPGYYVDVKGKCMKLPPNCLFANFQNGDCLECEEGYEINPPGKCT